MHDVIARCIYKESVFTLVIRNAVYNFRNIIKGKIGAEYSGKLITANEYVLVSGALDPGDTMEVTYTGGSTNVTAVPIPSINVKKERIIMQGELTSPVNPKPGCRFAKRCPYATEECTRVQPVQEEIRPNHFVACHHVREINGL